MKHSVFVGALEATAKIAGCAALVGSIGCTASSPDKDSGTNGSDDTAASVDSGSHTDTSVDSGLDTGASVDSGANDTGADDTGDSEGIVGDPNVDDDGDLYTENTGDCDDGDPNAFPGASGDDCGLADCNVAVAATFSESSPVPDADTESCCQLIANYYDQHYEDLMEWEERNQCCDLLEWQGSMACTPWGPPTPPQMPQVQKEIT